MLRPLTYWTDPPTQVRVYPCPSCQETISINAPSCRFCHVPVDLKVAEQLWADNQQLRTEKQQIAAAIKRANTFSVLTSASIVIIAITVLRMQTFGSLGETWVICQLLAVSYGVQWLSHNGSLVTDDANYLEAVAKVKRTMLVWAATFLVQVALYLILDGLPDLATILDLLVVD